MCLFRIGWIIAVVVAATAGRAIAQPAEQWDDQAVARSIQAAKAWLWSQWDQEQGHWPETFGERDNAVVVCPFSRRIGASCQHCYLTGHMR